MKVCSAAAEGGCGTVVDHYTYSDLLHLII